MSHTPSSEKKREATSPLDIVNTKKIRTPDLNTSNMSDSGNSETVQINLDEASVLKIADVLRSSFESQLGDMVSTIVSSVLDGVQSKLVDLQNENASLRDRVSQLEHKVEVLETREEAASQYSRRNCLRVSGIKEESGESMNDIVKTLAAEINADIELSDIDNMHRLGKPKVVSAGNHGAKKSTTRPRDIIVKFTSYRARQKVLTRRSALKNSKIFGGVYINEELTKQRGEVFYQARQLVKQGKLSTAWTNNGIILVKDVKNTIHRCESLSDLSKFQ